MSIASFLKSLPIDLGQANVRGTTKGKQIALKYIDPGQGKTALDIGCREGVQSEWLKARGYKVTSIDIEKVYQYAQIVDANKDLPCEDGSYDLIWCSEVLEHLDDPRHFRAEIDRLLEQLLAHSHEHLNLATEEVHWGHVGELDDWLACLRRGGKRAGVVPNRVWGGALPALPPGPTAAPTSTWRSSKIPEKGARMVVLASRSSRASRAAADCSAPNLASR